MIERQRVQSGAPLEPIYGYCRAVRVGDRVLVAGTAPIWPDGSCDPDPGVQARPASTMVVVAGLLDPRWKVEIEAEAILD
jgi:enamine deaminase RidA (YjgF/YER057c/UK114 family)